MNDSPTAPTCPMSRQTVIDRYFLEHRAKLLDLAAFLDRVDRAQPLPPDAGDFRMEALQSAIAILIDGKGERTRRILEHFSDPTTEPLESAAGMKGASGAYRPDTTTFSSDGECGGAC